MANDFLTRIQDYWLTLPNDRRLPYGMGCAWLGRRGLHPDRVALDVRVLEEAYAGGFRYFDTSSAYGESEFVTGTFISRVKREDVFVATKSTVPAGVSTPVAAAYVGVRLQASLERLRTAYIDVFQLHDITSLDQVVGDDGILPVLVRAKQEGRIRNIGIATRSLSVLEAAIDHGEIDSVLTYSDYTPIDQSAERLLDVAANRGVVVVNASPLSAGMLTDNDPSGADTFGEEEFETRKAVAIDLSRIVNGAGGSLLKLALQFPTRQPKIGITLTGPASVAELRSTLDALSDDVSTRMWEAYGAWNADRLAKATS